MLFRDFKEVVELLRTCRDVMTETEKYIKPEIFNSHNALIMKLLEQEYDWAAITYILNEWLCNNTDHIEFNPIGTNQVMLIPCKTVKEIWKAMETYGKMEAKH